MSDLISKSTTIKALESKKKGFKDCISKEEVQLNKEWNKAVDECISEIQMLPTAYNVDKVVEQLNVLHDLVNLNQKLAVSQSIDVVKAGGVNE